MKDNALGTRTSPLRTLLLKVWVEAGTSPLVVVGIEVPKEQEAFTGRFLTSSFRALAPHIDGKGM